MVILLDSFIAAHKVQHKNVEIDFLSILCLLSGMDVAEIWKMPSAAGREEGSNGHFQDALQPTGTELPFNPGFERKYNLHWLCVFSSLISVSPPVSFSQFKSRERSERDYLPPVCES